MISISLRFFFLLLPYFFLASAWCLLPDELISKRVHAHMVLKDYAAAADEALEGLQVYPQSKSLWQAYLQALAKNGDEKTMMVQWRLFIDKFPGEVTNREILECLAWGVIEKGSTSSSPLVRVSALLGAFFSQDAKGISLLLVGLRDENSFLRSASIQLASHLPDASLQDEILRLFRTEPVWKVRLEAIKAVGKLRIIEAKNDLIEIIGKNDSHIEEKAAAINALVIMSDGIDKEQLSRLVQSDRAGMRLLACEYIAYFEQEDDVDLLYPLIKDHHANVRAKLFQTLGRLRVPSIAGKSVADLAALASQDPDPTVSVTAAWVLTITDSKRGMQVFEALLRHRVNETRHLSAAALAATGRYGLPLAIKAFKESSDLYVKMNLAIGMIGQRAEILPACDCLYLCLEKLKERWEWREEGSFRILAKSKAKHDDAVPNYPEAVNQLTRLEVLEILSIVHYPQTQKAIKSFLQERSWGISGMASALLLTEGDENAVDIVKGLLLESDQKIKIEAALILALWGKGDDVVSLLHDAYVVADRELKGQILEGIGRVGSASSLLFLAEKLQEPYQTLRIIAAASLLECLYH